MTVPRAVAIAALFVFGGCDRGSSDSPERIVLIVIDTLRRDHLSPYGADVETPEIARLAQMGVAYDNALASFHMTSMSMGALWTGRTPALSSGDAKQTIAWNEDNWCGLARFGATSSGSCIPETMPRLGGEMRGLGYETIGVTANPLLFGAAGFSKGFDQWFEVPESSERAKLKLLKQSWQESSAARAAPEVTAAVATALAQRSSDRFFLYVHYMDVHDWAARGVPYRETVEAADRAVGELLLLLERQGLLDGAAIVLTSDHGESLDEQHLLPTTPRHVGNPSFEPVLEIPLIVVGTTLSRDETLIRSEDLFGLLLRIAGGAPPTASDLLPDELFITEQIYQTYRRGRWKSYSGRLDGTFRLVDLAADPDERFDVAEHHPQVVAAHRERVARLTASLAAPDAPLHEIDEAQRDRLRTLGYIE